MRDVTLTQRIGLGLIALLLAAGVGMVGIKAAQDAYADRYTLKAVFPRSGQSLDNFSTVKIRGVTIGQVASIRLRADGRSEVRLHVNRQFHVPDTVSASAEPLSVFGPKFIKLDPGAHEGLGPFLHNGDTISRTASPTEITDVVQGASRLLDAIDPHELATVIHTLGDATDGLGPELGRTVDHTAKVVGVLDARARDIGQLLADLAGVSGALAAKGKALTAGVRDLSPVLGEVASRPDQLGRLLDQTSLLSLQLANFINGHVPALDHILDGASSAVGAIYGQLAFVPNFLSANATLLGGLGERLLIYHLPDGHYIGVIRGPASSDPCFEFYGFPGCPPVVTENK